jgi:hypothetical protein
MDFKFEFTEKEINLILTGLAELPAKVSMEMIIKLRNLAQTQLNEFEKTKIKK